jgi:hypothetical protein
MSVPKDCPKCGMINPPEAQRCDCGYDFFSLKSERSFLGSHRPHRGQTHLWTGIASLFVCGFILGPMTAISATRDLRAIANGAMDPAGEGLTRAGQILGIAGTILWFLALIVRLLLVLGN